MDTILGISILKMFILFVFCDNLRTSSNLNAIKNQTLLNRVIRQKRLHGIPYLANCMRERGIAKNKPFLIRNGFTISPLWSNRTEYEQDSELPNKYNWSYSVSRANVDPLSEKVDPSSEPFDITEYLLADKKTIRVPPFTAVPGFYTVNVTIRVHEKHKFELTQLTHKQCYFYVKVLPPIAVIDGGTNRVVPDKANISISGRDSIDPNKPANDTTSLKFRWTCTQTATPVTICGSRPLSTEPELVIFAKQLTKDDTINLTLTVETEFGSVASTSQKLEVKPKSAMLRIRCAKNCPPITDSPNVQSFTFFRVFCDYNCEDIRDWYYRWTIEPVSRKEGFSFDYEKDTVFGREGAKFVIAQNILNASTDYLISVTLKLEAKRQGLASTIVRYVQLPQVQRCAVIPPAGVSLQTLFRLECVGSELLDRDYFYEFYVGSIGADTITSGFYPDVFKTRFFLPVSEGRSFTVKVSKQKGPSISLEVKPRVVSITDGKTSREALEIYKKFYKQDKTPILELMSSERKEKKDQGLKRFQALVNEIVASKISTNETKGFVKNLTYQVVLDALKSMPYEVPDLIILSDSLTKLINHHQLTKIDPFLAKMVTKICRLMVEKHAEALKKQKFPTESQEETNIIQSTLSKCLEANVHERYDFLAPIKRNITVLEIPNVQLETAIEENYPDYIDWTEDYETKIEEFHDITQNVIRATATAAKALALTMVVGEHAAKRSGQSSATVVLKDEGRELSNVRIQLLDTVVIPSADFEGSEHPFDILMSIWTKDLLWWNRARTRVSTNIVSLQFWHSTCKKRIRHFKQTVSIQFDMKNRSDFEVIEEKSNVTIPKDYSTVSKEELNQYIRVYRIDLPRYSTVYIDFHDVSKPEAFDVVVTMFEFPTIDDFGNDQVWSSSIQVPNQQNYDVWCYLGVLSNREFAESSKSKILFFNVSFTVAYCIRWIPEERSWQLDCKSGTSMNRTVINCHCNHFSLLAGYIENAESLVQEVTTIEIVVELQSFYVIFSTLVITFALFCFALFLSIFRKKSEIYYLADNARSDRYAYLLVVRTETNRDSGTTSNVTIRIIGKKRSSEPHVLNYPDPKMRLLQKEGEEIFVLATNQHLGEVHKIELWFDCTGASPSWYCRDIVVYDMQTRLQWYFRIRTIFTLHRDGITHLIISPTEKDPPGLLNQFRVCNRFHTWQLLATELNFAYIPRLAVVLSNILMNYMLVMLMLEVPELELRDCFDPYEKFTITGKEMHVTLMCSFTSFVVHVLIAWFFRFSDIEFTVQNKSFRRTHNLSWCCWVLLSLTIVVSMSFLLVYGFWVPVTSGFVWLFCCLVGLFLDVIIYENFFIIIQTFLCKFKLTVSIDQRFDNILRNIEAQRNYLYKRFDPSLLRPFLQHLYRPLQRMQIKRKKIVVIMRRIIYNDLEDLVMYGFYNILLYIMVLMNKSTLTVVSKNEVESMVEGAHTRTLGFSKIRSFSQIYDYINQTLIPIMHPAVWHLNRTIENYGMMIDNANKFIGVARLRQHRIMTRYCKIPEQLQFLNMTCIPEFSWVYAQTGDFGPKWTEYYPTHDTFSSAFRYSSEYETDTWLTIGRLESYSGGGYVAFLGRTLHNSYVNFQKLVDQLWIDDHTRSIFIEFLTYNANYNVFIAVRLLFELSASGYTSSFTEVNVVRMLFVENEVEIATMVFFVFFVFWVMMLNFKLIVGIVKYWRVFFKKVWLVIDCVINLMSGICISVFIIRMKMVGSYLEDIEKVKHNEFVSYFSMYYVEEFLTYFAGFLICIATARLWRFLRFGLFFKIMERTLSMAAFPLLAVTLGFFIVLTAFGLSGIIIFRDEFPDLAFFIKIVGALIQMALKPDQFDLTQFTIFTITYFYFAVYLIMMQIVLLIYVTVIIMAYVKAQLEVSEDPGIYTVQDYAEEQCEYLPKLIKTKIVRLRAGEAEKSPVTSKADEFRYANSVGVAKNRLKSMNFIAQCIFRNMRQGAEAQKVLTEHEANLMLDVCRTFVLKKVEGDEQEFFFKGHFEGQKIELIDEKKIDKIADFAKSMLETKPEKDVEAEPEETDRGLVEISQMVRRKIDTLKKCYLLLKLIVLKVDDFDKNLTDLLE